MSAAEDEVLRFPDGGCFGCSESNPHGLRLTFRRRGDRVFADTRIAGHLQGAEGIVHGGIVATLLDEISCAAVAFLRDASVVTGELSVRYHRPVPVNQRLELQAQLVDERHSRYAVVEATLRADGAALARSTGKFFYQERRESAP